MLSPRGKRILLWSGAGFLILFIAFVVTVFFATDDFLRHMAGTEGSAKLGREFSIDGPISIGWDWSRPDIHLNKVRLANRPGSKDVNMIEIERVDFHIKVWRLLRGQLNLPDISFSQPHIILEKYDDQTKNWDFPAFSKANTVVKTVLPTRRSNFPIIGQLTIDDGTLTYRDKTKDLDLMLALSTATGSGAEHGVFKLEGKGLLQNKPFVLEAQGGSLYMLRKNDEKYPLVAHIKMGTTQADIDGTFNDPIKMEGIDAKLDVRGDSMSDLFYLTLLPLPPTPTYRLGGHLTKKGEVWDFENFTGKVGNSDLEGNLFYDTSKPRGFMQAALTSHMLDMKDLAGFLGATPTPRANEKTSAKQVEKAAKEKSNPKLIPDVPINLTRLRATDLDVTLKAEKLLAPGFPMDNMNARFVLKDGVLKLDPLEFGIAKGKIKGSIVLDGTKDIPRVESDLAVWRLGLKQFFEGTRFEPLSKGFIGGRFQLAGHGKSLSDVMADSDGRVTFVMTGGTISQLLVDAAGLDVGAAAPILLGDDKATGIRCAVTDFDVSNGLLKSKVFVFDTTISNIVGGARINLKNETIDARIETNPKKPTVTAHAPIIIVGPLKHPAISLDLKEAAGRGAGAALLSVFLTPLAAIIPFIEAGVGKDSDCAALIGEARNASPATSAPSVMAQP